MAFRQTRIFVPSAEPMEHWYQTVVGKVIAPLVVADGIPRPTWFWFSQYISDLTDTADCDLTQIAAAYKLPLPIGGPPRHRSVRFRYNIADADRAAFEDDLNARIVASGYAHSGCLDHPNEDDLASHRFLGDVQNRDQRKSERAERVAMFYQSISKLFIDMLIPIDGGRFRLESAHPLGQNPTGKPFDTLYHLCGNISDCEVPIFVYRKQTPNQPDAWQVMGHVYGFNMQAALLADGWAVAATQAAKL